MERPNKKDYFEFRGDQIIIDYGSADNYIEALEEYIDHIEALNKTYNEISDIHNSIIDYMRGEICEEDFIDINKQIKNKYRNENN